jgi:peptide methionine sulfoxide reductase MsrB
MFARLQCTCPVVIEIFEQEKKYKELTKEEESISIEKGTEHRFTGKFYAFWKRGMYICKRCWAPLYRSESKVGSGLWMAELRHEIQGSVKRIPDPDGVRTEIICAKCGAHLGHGFVGEGFTEKNIRHCMNSFS